MPRVREHKWAEFANRGYNFFVRDKPTVMAVDVETTGLTWQDSAFGMSVSWHGPSRIESFWFELEDEYALGLAELLLHDHAHYEGVFVCHNLKFDKRMLLNLGIWPDGVAEAIDTLPAVALLDPTGEHGLKSAARKYLSVETYQDTQVKLARKELGLKRDDGYWPLPREVVVPYAMKDTEYTLRLHDKLMPMIQERGLQVAFDKEMRIVAEFLRMEMRGLGVDIEVVKKEIKVTDVQLAVAKSGIEGVVGRKVGKAKDRVKVPNGTSEKTGRELFKTIEVPRDLNLDSPAQVLAVFKERGVTLKSTESKVLEQVSDPLAEPLLKYRSETKLRQFQEALLKETDENGIVHPNLNSNGTATGRASSGAVRES